jgi:hypothetical protein
MVQVLSIHYEYGTLKPAKVILRRGWGKRESNGGDEPNWGILYHIWKCNSETHTHYYYILVKMLSHLLGVRTKEKKKRSSFRR